jgi:hypothetical protein
MMDGQMPWLSRGLRVGWKKFEPSAVQLRTNGENVKGTCIRALDVFDWSVKQPADSVDPILLSLDCQIQAKTSERFRIY